MFSFPCSHFYYSSSSILYNEITAVKPRKKEIILMKETEEERPRW